MNRHQQFSIVAFATAMLSLAAGIATPVHAQTAPAAGTVDLLTTPPELTAKVAPNVVLTFDDSGSMAWTYMPDSRPYDSNSWSTANASNPWNCAGVIDPRVTDTADPKSWPMNGVYFNPNTNYRPPVNEDGSSFPNSTYTSAWQNGIQQNRPTGSSNSTKSNLSTITFCGKSGAGYYRLKNTVSVTRNPATGKISNTGTLYTSGNWEWIAVTSAQQQNFANWYSYYRTRQTAAISATSHAFVDFDRGIRVAWQILYNNSPRVTAGTTRLNPYEGATRTDLYSWLFNVPANGGNTPNVTAADRVGQLFAYGNGVSDTRNPYWDPDSGRELACRKNFSIHVTDGFTNQSGIPSRSRDTTSRTLPDGRAYLASDAQSKIIWNEDLPTTNSFADLAFHYWATDLRPDFQNNDQTKLKVRPFFSSSAGTTNAAGNVVTVGVGESWLDEPGLYWNPANNPATWPHLVQYIIGFGVDGTIPQTADNLARLRNGAEKWPGFVNNKIQAVDDMWHAAVNSRGEFFSANNPNDLIDAMQKVIASVVAQSSSSTPASVSLPILTGGNSAYEGGYDSVGWPGTLRRRMLRSNGSLDDPMWDAGCLLTGGNCANPPGSNPAGSPNDRFLVTSNGSNGALRFRWLDLTNEQKYVLNQKVNPTGACASTTTGSNCDNFGSTRVDYLRGDRSNEAGGVTPQFRGRKSLLGAVINAQPEYVSSPIAGYHDMFPAGSPEQLAAAVSENNSYAGYQNAQRARKPLVYVASNDGMLHAFDAGTGKEHWAYIPDLLIRNGRLRAMTEKDADLIPGIDSAPLQRDVFIHGKWRTILIGSMRLGGRGVYALDVTNPVFNTEADVARTSASGGVVLWEFSNGDTMSTTSGADCAAGATTCSSLGYTYDSANIARIRYQNKWVAIVASGYFPDSKDVAAKASDISEAAANRTSLMVIDLETGKLLREIRTADAPQARPADFQTFGLSTPMVYDLGSDEVDDLVYAGDLAGNLWRFDLSADAPADWKVDLMFTSYGNGGAAKPGDQPFVFNPSALRDPVTKMPILIIGSGKYLGADDRTISIPEQAWYGIRDYGSNSSFYPIKVGQLVTQKLKQNADETREITGFDSPVVAATGAAPIYLRDSGPGGTAVITAVAAHGWRMKLNISAELGERAQRRAVPMPSANVALLYGLIPKSDDPCDPGARYSIMAFDGATGAPISTGGGLSDGRGVVGATAKLETPPGEPVTNRGGAGGTVIGVEDLPDAVKDAIYGALSAAIPPWHRGAWRELSED